MLKYKTIMFYKYFEFDQLTSCFNHTGFIIAIHYVIINIPKDVVCNQLVFDELKLLVRLCKLLV